jgi:hypothetical protein
MRSTLPLFAFALAVSAPVTAAETVPVAGFRMIQLRGGGDVTVVPGPVQRVTIVEGSSRVTQLRVERNGRLRIDACNHRCPRNYRLKIQIQSPRVPDLAISGGGSITAGTGFRPQPELGVAIHGGGRIDARAVDARDVSAAVNGGGEARVHARASLSAAVNGGGLVRYWGNPTVSKAVNGGGAVVRGY